MRITFCLTLIIGWVVTNPGLLQGASEPTAEPAVNLALVATPSSSYVSGDTSLTGAQRRQQSAQLARERRGRTATGRAPARSGCNTNGASPSAPSESRCIGGTTGRACVCRRRRRLQYWDGKEFVPVANASGLGVAGDQFNVTTFDEVTTSKLRLEMDGDGAFSTGILEWRVLDSGKSPDFPPSVAAGVDRVVILGGQDLPERQGAIAQAGQRLRTA